VPAKGILPDPKAAREKARKYKRLIRPDPKAGPVRGSMLKEAILRDPKVDLVISMKCIKAIRPDPKAGRGRDKDLTAILRDPKAARVQGIIRAGPSSKGRTGSKSSVKNTPMPDGPWKSAKKDWKSSKSAIRNFPMRKQSNISGK